MRPFPVRLALALSFVAGLMVGSALILSADRGHAIDPIPIPSNVASQLNAPDAQACNCSGAPENTNPSPRPRLAAAAPPLDKHDEAATLEAVHMALSEVGDGASYVWHRRGSKLSGIINPTSSFKDAEGRVCRHLVMTLTAGERSARTEGIACRMADRSWRLEG